MFLGEAAGAVRQDPWLLNKDGMKVLFISQL